MLFLYLIIAAVLLSTYRRPIAVFVPGLLPYFTYLSFSIMYCTCIPVVSINAVEGAGMSLGENVTGKPVTFLHP